MLIILIILVSALIVLVVYKGFFAEKLENNSSSESKTTITTKNTYEDTNADEDTNVDDENQVYEVDRAATAFELLEDDANVDIYTNFQNKKLKIGKIDFTFNCTDYNALGGNACDAFEILINNKSNNIKASVELETYLIVADDVVVISSGGYIGNMYLINSSGEKFYENEIVLSYRKTYEGFTNADGTPKLIDGKLYFYTKKDDSTLYKNYLDFQNGFDMIQANEIEGYIGEY